METLNPKPLTVGFRVSELGLGTVDGGHLASP